MAKTMRDYDMKLGINFHLKELLEECKKENDEIEHFFLIFNPEEEKLSVLCRYGSDDSTYTQHHVGDYDCSALAYATILTGVINSPEFITANTEKPATISVECGAYR